jgi:hypothetical protein
VPYENLEPLQRVSVSDPLLIGGVNAPDACEPL